VQATRPWFTPENQQVVKDSTHPSVVAPPLYDTTNLKLDVLVHLQGIGDTTTMMTNSPELEVNPEASRVSNCLLIRKSPA